MIVNEDLCAALNVEVARKIRMMRKAMFLGSLSRRAASVWQRHGPRPGGLAFCGAGAGNTHRDLADRSGMLQGNCGGSGGGEQDSSSAG